MNDTAQTPVRPLALVLKAPGEADLRAGGILLGERWSKGFGHEKLDVELVSGDEASAAMSAATCPVVLASFANVMDMMAFEAVAEHARSCGPKDVLRFTAEGLCPAPVVCLGAEAARAAAQAASSVSDRAIDAVIGFLLDAPGFAVRDVAVSESYWNEVRDEQQARSATWGMLQRLQYRPGGLVAIHLNRPLSIRMSRLVVNTGITPNQTTFFAFFLGAIGVSMLFLGGYGWAVVGTLLLHINSVIDGVDGELAKLRYQFSDFGAYLDSVCDEVLNSALLIGAGYWLSENGACSWYFPLGLFGGTISFLYALVHWHCKLKHGLGFYWWWEAYKPRKQVQRNRTAFFYFKKLFCKDSIILLFLFAAILNFMHILVLASAVSGIVTLMLFVIHIPIKRARW